MSASLLGILSVARDGIQAQSAALTATSQNVTNVNTPGYARRSARLEARPSGDGNGGSVAFRGFARSFDRRAFGRVVAEEGQRGAGDARAGALAHLEAIVAPSANSVADRLASFFTAVHAWSGTPAEPSARGGVLSQAATLADAVVGVARDIARERDTLGHQASEAAGEVNDRLARIAKLNNGIAVAQGRGDGAADLRDQRDALIREVATNVGARAIPQDDGTVTLVAAGVSLVERDRASSIHVDAAGAGGALRVRVRDPGGGETEVTARVDTGKLGGLREARDVDLVTATTDLDQFAYDLATTLNAVHAAGYGLDGVTGRALFTPPPAVAGAAQGLAVNAALVGRPERLAASAVASELPGGNGAAVALARLAAVPLGGGGLTPAGRYTAIAADAGARHAAAESERLLRADTLGTAEALHEATSGVSLDEEMVNLTRFQRAFEASARVMQTVDELLEHLMTRL